MFWCVSVFLTKLGPRQECSSSDEIEVTSGEEIWWLNMWSSIRGCEHWKKRTHLLVIISHPHIIILWFMTLNWSLRCILDDSFLLGTLSDVIRGWEKKTCMCIVKEIQALKCVDVHWGFWSRWLVCAVPLTACWSWQVQWLPWLSHWRQRADTLLFDRIQMRLLVNISTKNT